jgi:hypothetical protein
MWGISLACLTVTLAAQTPRAITNGDIIRMVKAGFAEDTIILAFSGSAVDFDSGIDALINLKGQGVTDKVITAMLNAVKKTAPPAAGGNGGVAGPTGSSTTSSQPVSHRHGVSNGQSIVSGGVLSEYPGGMKYVDSSRMGDFDVPCQGIQNISLHRPTPTEALFIEILLSPTPSSQYGTPWDFTSSSPNSQWAVDTAARLAAHCSMTRSDQRQVAQSPPAAAPPPRSSDDSSRSEAQARIAQLDSQLQLLKNKYANEVKQLQDAQSQGILLHASCNYANNSFSKNINCLNAQLQDQEVANHQRSVKMVETEIQDMQSQLNALRSRQ